MGHEIGVCIVLISIILGFVLFCHSLPDKKISTSRICIKGIVYKKVDGVYQELFFDGHRGENIKCVEVKN
jgi:hypothetical protein